MRMVNYKLAIMNYKLAIMNYKLAIMNYECEIYKEKCVSLQSFFLLCIYFILINFSTIFFLHFFIF